MLVSFLMMILCSNGPQSPEALASERKQEFIVEIQRLSHRENGFVNLQDGDIQSELKILISLKETDVNSDAIQPLLEFSRAIYTIPEARSYMIDHYPEIENGFISLFWGIMFFEDGYTHPAVVANLNTALKTPAQEVRMRAILGGRFNDFVAKLRLFRNSRGRAQDIEIR